MQEVETQKDPPLQQQAEKTDTIPDYASLFYWETAGLVTHFFCFQVKGKNAHYKMDSVNHQFDWLLALLI